MPEESMTGRPNDPIYRRNGRLVISPDGILTIFRPNSFKKLNDSKYLSDRLKELDLSFTPIESVGKLNTNAGQGFRETRIDIESIAVFDRFIGRLSGKTLDRIRYFSEYDPRRSALVTF